MDKPVFFVLAMLTSVWIIGVTSFHNSPIEGRIYCEFCHVNFATQSLEGSTVCLECKHYRSDNTCQVEQKEDHQEDICEVALVNRSSANCREIPECSSARTRFELMRNNGMPSAICVTDPLGFLHAESLMNCAEADMAINIFSGGRRYKKSLQDARIRVATRDIRLEARIRELGIVPNIILVLPEGKNRELFYLTINGLEQSLKFAYLKRNCYLIGVFVGNDRWLEFLPQAREDELISNSEKLHVTASYANHRSRNYPLSQTRVNPYKLNAWINEINEFKGEKTCPKLIEYLDTFILFTSEALHFKSITDFFAGQLDGSNEEYFGQDRVILIHRWGRLSEVLLLARDNSNGVLSEAAREILLAKPCENNNEIKKDEVKGKGKAKIE